METAQRIWIRVAARLVSFGGQPADHSGLGRAGERRAAWYFRLLGFRILAVNLRNEQGEIDLIVRRFGLVAFVEVKTRGPERLGAGWTAVDRTKQLRIIRAASLELARMSPAPTAVRFDVVSIDWDRPRISLQHFPDAFRPLADPRYPWKLK